MSTKERGRKGMQQFFPFAGDLKTISPLSLAYVGDGVYELMIRERLIGAGNCPPKKLHTAAVALAKAPAQAFPCSPKRNRQFSAGGATLTRPGGCRRTHRWRSTTRQRHWNACLAGST